MKEQADLKRRIREIERDDVDLIINLREPKRIDDDIIDKVKCYAKRLDTDAQMMHIYAYADDT